MSDGERFCIGGRCFPVTTLFGEPAVFTGEPHFGVDVATPLGTPVEAGIFGSVRRVFSEPVGGLQVELTEQGGARRLLAHLGSVAVRAGEPVAPATIIGTSGESGVVTGPHLHLADFDPSGRPIDPLASRCPRGFEWSERQQRCVPSLVPPPIELPRPPDPATAGEQVRRELESGIAGAIERFRLGAAEFGARAAVVAMLLVVIVALALGGVKRIVG